MPVHTFFHPVKEVLELSYQPHYLCNDGDSHISTLAFRGDKWVNTRTFNDIPLEVVKYWMPIPEPPKE